MQVFIDLLRYRGFDVPKGKPLDATKVLQQTAALMLQQLEVAAMYDLPLEQTISAILMRTKDDARNDEDIAAQIMDDFKTGKLKKHPHPFNNLTVFMHELKKQFAAIESIKIAADESTKQMQSAIAENTRLLNDVNANTVNNKRILEEMEKLSTRAPAPADTLAPAPEPAPMHAPADTKPRQRSKRPAGEGGTA